MPLIIPPAIWGTLADTVLTTGEEAMHRSTVATTGVATSSQSLRLTYFTARKSETVTQVRVLCGGTAAGATPSLCRVGVYSVAANGDLTLVASIANDTALFATQNTAYTRSLSASFDKVAGQRYALAILVVTAAATPTFPGSNTVLASEAGVAPRLSGSVSGQSDLPSSVAAASVNDTGSRPYGVLLP